jgi:hypothetical protein
MYELPKPHVTIMKSQFDNEVFEVKSIMDRYRNFEIEDIMIKSIDISYINIFDNKGFYKPMYSLKI